MDGWSRNDAAMTTTPGMSTANVNQRDGEKSTLMMSLVLLGCLNTSLAREKNDDSPRFHYYRIRKSLLHTIYNLLFVFQVMPPSTPLRALGVSLSVLFTQLMSFKVSQIFSPVVDTVVRKLLSSRVHRLECASPSTFLHRTLFSSIKHSLGAAAAVSTNDSPWRLFNVCLSSSACDRGASKVKSRHSIHLQRRRLCCCFSSLRSATTAAMKTAGVCKQQ